MMCFHPLLVLGIVEFGVSVDHLLDGGLTYEDMLSPEFFLNFVFTLFQVAFPDIIDSSDDPG